MRYYQEVSHSGLNKHRVISDTDPGVLSVKVRQQLTTWDEEWSRKCETERERDELRRARELERQERDAHKREVERERNANQRKKEEEKRRREEALLSDKEQASKRTARAQKELDDLHAILKSSLTKTHALDWETLLDHAEFSQPRPNKPKPPVPPTDAIHDIPEPFPPVLLEPERPPVSNPPKLRLPSKPSLRSLPPPLKPKQVRLPHKPETSPPQFSPPAFGLLDVIPSRRSGKMKAAEAAYHKRLADAEAQHAQNLRNWERFCSDVAAKHRQETQRYDERIAEIGRLQAQHAENLQKWERLCEEATTKHREEMHVHNQRIAQADRAWEDAMSDYRQKALRTEEEWHVTLQRHRKAVAEENVRRETAYNDAIRLYEADWQGTLSEWTRQREEFVTAQKERNDEVLQRRELYHASDSDAVTEYFRLVLGNSTYPFCLAGNPSLEYITESKVIVVDFVLPQVDDLPTLKEVRFVQSRKEFTEHHLSQRDAGRLYGEVLYQVALRTTYELYDADVACTVASVVFNGWTTNTDKATGKEVTACIMSLQTLREAFLDINLAEVDPKECFRKLKGLGSPQLHTLTPVAPVVAISREDARFVASYDVTGELDDSFNLAAMDWEDFEHLVRELFEQEFSQNGGEVKVTQASRDGGVDAIAFDPDPIRGGKIVIQAKRYTNIVSVSAVRDLYGTVVNEGATKGILVCTSDYGPDAHEFAQGKPLTLLNGNNLLHLLGKHGHRAKIDIDEAKQILANKDREARGDAHGTATDP